MKDLKPVRILILEDNNIDKRIIFSIIENSEINYTTLIVDNKEEFTKSIVGFKPDIVLSDYVLPGFDGREALEIHKKYIPNIPFIFVTGQLSEETAIECLKMGAWDYIMKDHLKRLPVSIKNALALKLERTENKLKAQTISESEKRYKSLSELTFEGIVIHKNGILLDCNLSFCRMFGYDRDELINKDMIDLLIHPDDRNLVLEKANTGHTAPYESRGIKKDGTVFPVEQEAKIISYNGENARVVALRDITSRKEALAEIKLSEEKFHKISNAAKDAIILLDENGNVSFWNKAASELFQYSVTEILGKNFHNLMVPEKYLEAHNKGFAHFLKTGRGNAIGKITELEAIRKDGETILVELSLSSINIHGKWNAVGILRDITTRKKAETEMLAARKYAQEMSQMKNNFLSTMSHELRTPLNGILGFSEILFECLENAEYKEYANTILKSSERILNTFNLIIDLAVLDANKVTVNKKSENIVNIIENACESYLSQATEKNLYLNQKINVINTNAEIDQTLLTQALNNLLNNAIKYTSTGGITVSLHEEIMNNTDCFAVSVSDTGIGIPKEMTSLIYQAFRQVSEGYSRSFEGMGLGLYITKKYVDLLEGFIDMKSENGRGTSFTIFIPVRGDDSLANTAFKKSGSQVSQDASPAKTKNILYVEDDASHRQFVHIFLKNQYNITCVENGLKAMRAVVNQHFDVILIDINLGKGMNGLEVIKKIRAIPDYHNTPIAAVTANALVSQKDECLSKGFTDYIIKPFRKKTLLEFIENALLS